ncbi:MULTISPECIES: tripartite tricarboxylate transporter permease [Rhodobacterales]|uniref:tripartite tricarboxylate transporter permease n=1 Tax=Roseobacter sp. N2S TaxID=2663844 RepID=UPI0028564CBB|nr:MULTISPECIES: tripartite tricarboxylate transporter permease [Rhodobacterales]MDR6265838.1 TctA family transporter [Roseobacter sp. N2S]
MSIFENLALGFSVALTTKSLSYCFVGVTLGTLVGVLPGLGTLAAIAMLLPLTFQLDPATALIMLAGIYYGVAYGGSTASILLNLPGTPNTAVTALDGYPMTKAGRAGVALFMTTIASFFGSVVGIIALAVGAPLLANVALNFGSPEYFSLLIMGLLAAALLSSGRPFRAVGMVVIGLLIGTVGMDSTSGYARYSFDIPELFNGFNLVAVVIGLFGLPEVIHNAGKIKSSIVNAQDVTLRSMIPTRDDWRRSFGPMVRGTGIGGFFGALPGTGGTVATFVSYAVERKINKDPSRFGKGAIEGIAGPESANNAAIQTAFIPTLTLGIPGDVVMALILATLIIHGIQPGPAMIPEHPELFWGLAASFLVGNVMLLALNIPMIGIWVRMVTIPYKYLFPIITVLVCIGVYSISNSTFDVWMVVLFALLGYAFRLLKCEPAPLLLGFILGPMLEEHLRRAMLIARGDATVFVTRPLSAIFLGICIALVALMLWSGHKQRRLLKARRLAELQGET